MQFGNKDGDQIYCRVEGNSGIAKVSDSFSSTFAKNLEDWREKKLVIFNRFDTEKVRIIAAGKDYQLSKNKEENWSEQSPDKGEIDTDKIQDLLEKLENAEINKYTETAALEGPGSLEVFLSMRDWQDKVTTRHINFGKVDGNTQSAKNDDYNTVVLVDATLQPNIIKALSEIKPRAPTAPTKKK